MPKRNLGPVGSLVLGLCGSLMGPACQPSANEQEQKAPSTQREAQTASAVDAQCAPTQLMQVPDWAPIVGALTAQKRALLAANASGRVTATHVERGQRVKAGDVLLTLDVRAARNAEQEARANLASLKAQRASADADCKRYESLREKQAISQQEYERVNAQCAQLRAQFAAAEARTAEAARALGDAEVRAPFTGLVSERSVQVGDFVRPDSPVAVLIGPESLRLKVSVPEAQASLVRPDAQISFTVAAYPHDTFTAKVRYVSQEVETRGREIVFEADVADANGRLWPGMFATGRLYGGARVQPVIPAKAIVQQGDHAFVYLCRAGRLQKHVVRTGATLDAGVVIEAGLESTNPSDPNGPRDAVAQAPSAQWRDGQPYQ